MELLPPPAMIAGPHPTPPPPAAPARRPGSAHPTGNPPSCRAPQSESGNKRQQKATAHPPGPHGCRPMSTSSPNHPNRSQPPTPRKCRPMSTSGPPSRGAPSPNRERPFTPTTVRPGDRGPDQPRARLGRRQPTTRGDRAPTNASTMPAPAPTSPPSSGAHVDQHHHQPASRKKCRPMSTGHPRPIPTDPNHRPPTRAPRMSTDAIIPPPTMNHVDHGRPPPCA
jgi:hypothetical protein